MLGFIFIACCASQFAEFGIDNNGSGANSFVFYSNKNSSSLFEFPKPEPATAQHLRGLKKVGRRSSAFFAFDEPTGAYNELCGSESPTFSSSGTGKLFLCNASGCDEMLNVQTVDPSLHAIVDVSVSPSENVAFAIATAHYGGQNP